MPNDVYINQDDAVYAVFERIRQIGMEGNPYVLSIRQAVRDVPAADVEGKRLEGVWLEQPEKPNVGSNKIYRCSICGYGDEQSPTAEVPYCWHCGSRMRKMQKKKV